MQAKLSELQKMFCQLSESVNVNKNIVRPYTGVSFSDSKSTHPKRYVPTSHKKRSLRRNSLNKLLTHNFRAQNQRYIIINIRGQIENRPLQNTRSAGRKWLTARC